VNQEKIWDYFQTEGVDAFSESNVRLDFLFRKARKIAGGRRLRVLNIGAGNGWLERRCMREGWETFSLDPSVKAIERLVEQGISGRVGNMESMPFEGGSFHVVFCSEVIEHLADQQMAEGVREVRRVLAGSGSLIGSVPFREDLSGGVSVCPECGNVFHRWGHQQSFDRKRLGAVLSQSGLSVTETGTYAFLDFSKGTMRNRIRLSLHWILGRAGIPIGTPTLYFIARKSSGGEFSSR
jgi:2-polyprenyl-3-methyl-5-hydroxy-6-metoxy-1,4-benzoquinol methylase